MLTCNILLIQHLAYTSNHGGQSELFEVGLRTGQVHYPPGERGSIKHQVVCYTSIYSIVAVQGQPREVRQPIATGDRNLNPESESGENRKREVPKLRPEPKEGTNRLRLSAMQI